MQERHVDVPHVVFFAILDTDVRKPDRCGSMEEDRRACHFGQSPGAGQMVGLHVGFDDMGDPHRLLGRGFEIRLDLQLWIHHSAAGCPSSAEQVTRAPGLRRQELTKDHDEPSFCPLCYAARAIGSNTYLGLFR